MVGLVEIGQKSSQRRESSPSAIIPLMKASEIRASL